MTLTRIRRRHWPSRPHVRRSLTLAVFILMTCRHHFLTIEASSTATSSLWRPFLPRSSYLSRQTALRIRGGKRGDDDKRNRNGKEQRKQENNNNNMDDDSIAMAIAEAESAPSLNNETALESTVGTSKTRQPLNVLFANSMAVLLPKLQLLQRSLLQFGPSLLTIAGLITSYQHGQFQKGVTYFNLYGLALLGASCGFSLFLYFITVGFALGVTLPLAVSLFVYQKRYQLPTLTFFHSAITILWGLRLLTFLMWREHVSWPALHQKVVEVQAKLNIPFASKLLCWLVYSFFYVGLMSSCWSRLLQSAAMSTSDPAAPLPSVWGVLGIVGLLMQSTGLILETVADAQKNAFKSRNHLSWCNVGLWKFSTHPNYLGDGLFWIGTYLAHGFHSIILSALATSGLIFIMVVLKGASRSLASKQKEKYGQTPGFLEFQRSHNVFGPKRWWVRSGNATLDETPIDSVNSNITSTAAASAEGDNNGSSS